MIVRTPSSDAVPHQVQFGLAAFHQTKIRLRHISPSV
jgi:hypothetical protein